MNKAAANRYLADRVLTATPAQLIGMLYDVAVRALMAANSALLEGSRPGATSMLLKAQDAVTELRCSLVLNSGDRDADALAARLDSIYEYVFLKLVRASLGRDDAAISECHALLNDLREAWRDGCIQATAPVPAGVA